jgi:hypothetical protein
MNLIGQLVRTPSNAQSAGEKDRLGGLGLVYWEIPEKPKDFQAVERSGTLKYSRESVQKARETRHSRVHHRIFRQCWESCSTT